MRNARGIKFNMKTPAAVNPQIAGNLEAFKARFDVPRAAFILHGAEKFEIRFRPARAWLPRLVFTSLVFFFMVLFTSIFCGFFIIIHYYGPNLFSWFNLFFMTCLLSIIAVFSASLLLTKRVLKRPVFNFLEPCFAGGIIANTSLRLFTIWRGQPIGNRSNTTVTFHDTREFQIQPDSRVALVAKGGRKIPFTFPLAPDAALALQTFLRSVVFPDFLHHPRLEKSDTPQSAETKFLLKQRGPDLMRFYQRG